MADRPRPSLKFLLSDGTTEDFEEFWAKDPIGAAQYASALSTTHHAHFEGLEEVQGTLGADDLSLEAKKERLLAFAKKSPKVFRFVEATHAAIESRDETLGWKAS